MASYMSTEPTNSDPDSRVVNVSADGRTTIPESVREALGVEAAGSVRFDQTGDGRVVVVPVPDAGPADVSGETGDAEEVNVPSPEAADHRCGRWGDERWR